MTNVSQVKASKNDRKRLSQRGLARYEVRGRDDDRALVRAVARRMAEDDPEAARLREAVSQALVAKPRETGGILAALRRSPLVGADLDFSREETHGRSVDF